MGRTNYTKVDAVTDDGLRKMAVNRLLDETKQLDATAKEQLAKAKLLESLKRDVTFLDPKRHKTLYTQLGMKRQEVKTLIANPSSLSAEDWEKIKQIKSQIETYRKEVMALLPTSTDEKLVDRERKKHINKRYNVKDDWLPLH